MEVRTDSVRYGASAPTTAAINSPPLLCGPFAGNPISDRRKLSQHRDRRRPVRQPWSNRLWISAVSSFIVRSNADETSTS
jgi:hypothetical protein